MMSHIYLFLIMQLNQVLTPIMPLIILTVLDHQMWDSLLKVDCSLEEVSSSWRLSLKKDLMKRISKVSNRLVIRVKWTLFVLFQ